jgi:APA family basic amino acid/polyamine antiporter
MERNVVKPGHKLGLWAAVALVIGNMIGSGVFLLPATLAPLGWNAVIGWLVSIGGSVLLALSIALLARKVSGRSPRQCWAGAPGSGSGRVSPRWR